MKLADELFARAAKMCDGLEFSAEALKAVMIVIAEELEKRDRQHVRTLKLIEDMADGKITDNREDRERDIKWA